MLTLPQTAEYALRAVCYIAEHETAGPIPGPAVADALGAPANYLSKTLHQLRTLGVLRSVRGAQGGYRLAVPPAELRLLAIVEPFLPEVEHRCIMGHAVCSDRAPCGAHWRWRQVKDVTRAFFAELTVADLLTGAPRPALTLLTSEFREMTTSPVLPTTTVNDLLRRAPTAAPVLNALGIDTCCGGGLSLAEAAQSAGIPTSELLAKLAPMLEAA
ncbi:MAG TPA: DUF542 domain-containing protein [Gemmatimonadales bacterium]|nr:DUF542 domain-containing protein [Gemmatimonadales bacterium]